MLRELKHHQDRLKKQADMQKTNDDEEVIPNKLKPYMDRKIDFNLYTEILMTKVDKQHIQLD